MAIAKPRQAGRRHRRWRQALLALVAAALIAGGLMWPRIHARSMLGAAYGARIACSCRFVGGRSLKDCSQDFEPGMALVTLSENAQAHAITARVPLIATQTATFRQGQGCLLQPWTAS